MIIENQRSYKKWHLAKQIENIICMHKMTVTFRIVGRIKDSKKRNPIWPVVTKYYGLINPLQKVLVIYLKTILPALLM